MNPQHPDLESGALPLELLASERFRVFEFRVVAIPAISVELETRNSLLGFLMGGVLATPTTVLTQFESIRGILFTLRRCVIPPLAITAG